MWFASATPSARHCKTTTSFGSALNMAFGFSGAGIKDLLRGHHATLSGLKHTLCPKVMDRLQLKSKEGTRLRSAGVIHFMKTAKAAKSGNTLDEISMFLKGEGFGTKELDLMLEKAIVPGMSIDKKLRPVLQWFSDLELQKSKWHGLCLERRKLLALALSRT